MRPGPLNLITDVPGLWLGQAQDLRLRSGVSLITAEQPFTAAVHGMGGAPGTCETDLLAPDKLVAGVDALVLSGGSAFGLAACAGVAEALAARGRGFAVGPVRVPIVPGAILFDLLNGGEKPWLAPGADQPAPYHALGRQALLAARPGAFALGTEGAGTGAFCHGVKGGLGSASAVLQDGLVVGALVAVNALGSPLVPGSRRFWAAPWEMAGEFGGLGLACPPDPGHEPPAGKFPQAQQGMVPGPGQATTIAIVATNAALSKAQAQRLAIAAHDGMARALVPSHTPLDGDLVFAAATGERALHDPVAQGFALGHAGACCLARAIARAVHAARPLPGDPLPAWCSLQDPA